MKKHIVIVGAGYAGVLTAKKLAKKFKKYDEVSVTIIDKNPYHTMLTELHEVAAGRVDEDSIRISLKKIFAGRRVNVVLDEVTSIDFDSKKVVGTADSYNYDYLVIAAGSKPTYFGVQGAKEHAYKLWSYDDAILLKEHILDCFRKASACNDSAKKKELLTFYVVGAGFTGVEMIGELAEYVPYLCEQFEIDPKEVGLYNVDVLSRSVPVLTEKQSIKVQKRLSKMNVVQMLETKVIEIGENFIKISRNDKVEDRVAGTVIWAAGIESSDITNQAAQSLASENRGRIRTDKYLRSESDQNVYIVGDNMYYIPEGENGPVPQMVENCEQSADVAAKNIFADITDKKELEEYHPSFHGVMVCIGGRYGVAYVGLPGKFFGLPSFLAMFAKHFINIIYFVQILGWNKVWSYLKHEFFTIRNRRSFVGGHLSNRSPSFLVVPLRLWLGAVWVFEGVKKIFEGWFGEANLTNFIGNTQKWYDGLISGTPDIIGGASDATGGASPVANTVINAASDFVTTLADKAAPVIDTLASATGAGTEGAAEAAGSSLNMMINWDIFGWFRILFLSTSDWLGMTLDNTALKINIPLLNSFFESFVYPNDWLQITFQIMIVIFEIAIGLALIGGLFTTPASALSLFLQVMFLTTTGLYMTSVWMIFAAIAIMFVGSRSLSLDYYAMPWLKKKWNKTKLARKSYLYHD